MTICVTKNLLFITLDTLRYDVAQQLFESGDLPLLSRYLPVSGWEKRHSPASFTYAAHQAFFAGFLPTPITQGPHPRRFALTFAGSESIDEQTRLFDAPNIVQGFADAGYRTVCIGGVGFFNRQNALGRVLPGMFQVQEWCSEFGVTQIDSTEYQVACALRHINAVNQPLLLFINISAIHQPNRYYLPGSEQDNLASHGAALCYVDGALAPLLQAPGLQGNTEVIICSDHGTLYGEQGYTGHRLAHPHVWEVPYAEFEL